MRRSHFASLLIAAGLVLLVAYFWPEAHQESTAAVIPVETAVKVITASEAVHLAVPHALEQSAQVERKAIAGPHGTVVEAISGDPVEGLTIQMKFGKKILATTVTLADGSFHLPQPERSRRIIEVISDTWRISPRRQRLDDEQSAGLTEVPFQAKRILAAPLRGWLVDRHTGEPVPDFLITARGPRAWIATPSRDGTAHESEADGDQGFYSTPIRSEDIVTGDDGRFESASGFEAGHLDLVLVDHPSLRDQTAAFPTEEESLEHEHSFDRTSPPAEAKFPVRIGPTYRLDLTLPAGMRPDDFYATFPQQWSAAREMHKAFAGDTSSPLAQFYGSGPGMAAIEGRAPLRIGRPAWARFRTPVMMLDAKPGEAGNHDLHVRSIDGYWSGKATVTSLEGIYADVLHITLAGNGTIAGTVQDGMGNPVPTAWVQLISSGNSSNPFAEVGADVDGHFAFEWLPEADYEVVLQTDLYDEWRTSVSIVPGSTKRLEAILGSSLTLGPVSGVLRSQTGKHRAPASLVLLKSLNDPEFSLYKIPTYRRRDGEYLAAFAFDAVPSGDYELTLQTKDNMRWNTRRVRVSPPAEDIEFICLDDVETFDLIFRAYDEGTGDAVPKFWSIVWQGDPMDGFRLQNHWESGRYEAVPEGVPLDWTLNAEGYRLAHGDASDMLTDADGRVIEARLQRGWGQTFKVTTRKLDPISDVELIANGLVVGVTNAQGMVSMNLDAKPLSLGFRYEGWHVSWGRIEPAAQGFGLGPETPVYLSPDQE